MTTHIACSRSAGSSGPRRGKEPGGKPGAPGSVSIPLTQRKSPRIFQPRGVTQGESAGIARFAPVLASATAVSPTPIGRKSIMPRSRGNLRSLACNLITGDLHSRLVTGLSLIHI